MSNRSKKDKAALYRKRRNIYFAAAAVCYICGGLLAVAAKTRGALIAVSIPPVIITLFFLSMALLYAKSARAAARRSATRASRISEREAYEEIVH